MKTLKRSLLTILITACSFGFAGCSTILYCDGVTPYSQGELPRLALEPLPAPDSAVLRQAAERVVTTKPAKAEDWDEVGDGLLFQTREVPFQPSHSTDSHWIAWDGVEGHRVLYVVRQLSNEASLIMGYHAERTDVYDTENGERLASWGRSGIGWVLLVGCDEHVEPATIDGTPAMRKIMAREIEPPQLRYERQEGWTIALGLGGWGRSNHRKYIQVLWIPIPTGEERP